MDPQLATIGGFFLNGILASEALYRMLVANGGNLDLTLQVRNWHVTDRYDARLVGELTAGQVDPPPDLGKET